MPWYFVLYLQYVAVEVIGRPDLILLRGETIVFNNIIQRKGKKITHQICYYLTSVIAVEWGLKKTVCMPHFLNFFSSCKTVRNPYPFSQLDQAFC